MPNHPLSRLEQLKSEAAKEWDSRRETFLRFYEGAPRDTQLRLAHEQGFVAGALTQSESKRFRCEVCKDTGQVPVGNSGLESDGNAPVFDPCPECRHDKPQETPRTDAVLEHYRLSDAIWKSGEVIPVLRDHARQLERELAESRQMHAELQREIEKMAANTFRSHGGSRMPDNVGDSDRWEDHRDISGGATDCTPSSTPRVTDAELQRLREIEHMAWHFLESGAEHVADKQLVFDLPNEDYDKLIELLPEGHPEPSLAESANGSSGEWDRLMDLLENIVDADDANSGAEPSVSVLDRAIEEARRYVRRADAV
jgi:hypothetical protein